MVGWAEWNETRQYRYTYKNVHQLLSFFSISILNIYRMDLYLNLPCCIKSENSYVLRDGKSNHNAWSNIKLNTLEAVTSRLTHKWRQSRCIHPLAFRFQILTEKMLSLKNTKDKIWWWKKSPYRKDVDLWKFNFDAKINKTKLVSVKCWII